MDLARLLNRVACERAASSCERRRRLAAASAAASRHSRQLGRVSRPRLLRRRLLRRLPLGPQHFLARRLRLRLHTTLALGQLAQLGPWPAAP